MDSWLKVEFHCHTTASKDSLNRVEDLLRTARQRGIQRLMVTDHNTIKGALEARRLDPELVIVGEEVLTLDGELLAYFVTEEVPHGLPPEDAIRLLRQQGCFISVPHPFDRRRHGWAPDDLARITPLVDAIEVFNSRCQLPVLNTRAAEYAAQHNLPGTVGSDAHTLDEVGRSTLTLPYFSTADELRQVIRLARPETLLSSPLIHFSSTFARYFKALFKKASPNT
ncbi:MAG TPA: PHP domain-containing protein [Anaerolineaceae bacterium]|nr:PHP domain-containing protein [Anaerolineaceae bacterium]